MPYRTINYDDYLDGALASIDTFNFFTKPVFFSNKEKREILIEIILDVYSGVLAHKKFIAELLRKKYIFIFFYKDMIYERCGTILNLVQDFQSKGISVQSVISAVERRWGNA